MNIKRAIPVLFLAFAVVLTAQAQDQKHAEHDFSDAEHWAKVFEPAERYKWQRPEGVLYMTMIDVGHHVADIGAGTGYFTRMLSETVGPRGKVYAVDTSQEMLDYISGRDDILYENVVSVLAEPNDPKLPEGELDVVLIVNTWHHIENRAAYLKKLAKTLKQPSGRVAIIDWHKRELPMGPPPEIKLSRDEVVAEFEKAGWKLTSQSVMLQYQYFMIFFPPKS